MVERIVLHIGAEKTGSTSLQAQMCQSPAWLTDAGVCYPVNPRFKRIRANAKPLTYALQGAFPPAFQRSFPNENIADFDPATELSTLLDHCPEGAKTAVLSSELLRPHHAAPLRAVMPEGVTCDVVMVVRRQDRWLMSYYGQCLKDGRYLALDEVLEGILEVSTNGYSCPDWHHHHRIWRDTFGACHTLFFDDATRPYQSAFYGLIGTQGPATQDSSAHMNTGLTAFDIAHLAGLDAQTPAKAFKAQLKACQQASTTLHGHLPKVTLLSPSHRARLIERFAQGNAGLVQDCAQDAALLDIPATDAAYVPLEDIAGLDAYTLYRSEVLAQLKAVS